MPHFGVHLAPPLVSASSTDSAPPTSSRLVEEVSQTSAENLPAREMPACPALSTVLREMLCGVSLSRFLTRSNTLLNCPVGMSPQSSHRRLSFPDFRVRFWTFGVFPCHNQLWKSKWFQRRANGHSATGAIILPHSQGAGVRRDAARKPGGRRSQSTCSSRRVTFLSW